MFGHCSSNVLVAAVTSFAEFKCHNHPYHGFESQLRQHHTCSSEFHKSQEEFSSS